jgi:hypothetical protein
VVVGAGTVPVVAALETNFYGLQVAQGQTFAGKVTLTVPPDYDSSIDELRIRIAANRGGRYRRRCDEDPQGNHLPQAASA